MRCRPSWSRCCRIVRRVEADRGLITGRCSKRSCGGSGPGLRGGSSCGVPGLADGGHRFNAWSGDGTFDRILQVVQGRAQAAGEVDWTVSVDATIARAHQHAAGRQIPKRGLDRITRNSWHEPDDHALGRSRGAGPQSACRCRWQRPTAQCGAHRGAASDNPQLMPVIDAIAVPTGARPRCRPQVLIADKAYRMRPPASCCAHAASGRSSPAAQRPDRHRIIGAGRWPAPVDADIYKLRNVVGTRLEPNSNNGARLPPLRQNTPETMPGIVPAIDVDIARSSHQWMSPHRSTVGPK